MVPKFAAGLHLQPDVHPQRIHVGGPEAQRQPNHARQSPHRYNTEIYGSLHKRRTDVTDLSPWSTCTNTKKYYMCSWRHFYLHNTHLNTKFSSRKKFAKLRGNSKMLMAKSIIYKNKYHIRNFISALNLDHFPEKMGEKTV